METNSFLNKVRQYAANRKTEEQSVDWSERKEWWQQKVNTLLTDIESWLRPLIDDNTISFERQTYQANEEALGVYVINTAQVKLDNQSLNIRPVGSVIVGGFGRVDLTGPNGAIMLILTTIDKDIPSEESRNRSSWFYAHPERRTQLSPLNQTSFEQIFTDLFGMRQ